MTANPINENLTKDGRVITCQWSNTPLQDSDGKFIGFISLAQDISDMRRAAEALRAAEQRLRHVVASSPAVLFTLALEEGNSAV